MLFMNEFEIDEAVSQTKPDTVRGLAARILSVFRDIVNENSDGWAYWSPANAAKQLQELVQLQNMAVIEPDLTKAMKPICSFCTKHGFELQRRLLSAYGIPQKS